MEQYRFPIQYIPAHAGYGIRNPGAGVGHKVMPMLPAGLEAIYGACRRIYPNQPNPLQVTAVVKFWLGGPDPLDYISMYDNTGDAKKNISPHWHYVSFGLTDLHGDGRVHGLSGGVGPSGFGFELTMRVQRKHGENSPPLWPAKLLQSLARYVFSTGNLLYPYDHVSWHEPLDQAADGHVKHILLIADPQLPTMSTVFGTVQFIQVVGITDEELEAVQRWNGPGVARLLTSVSPWHVTDPARESLFASSPGHRAALDAGVRAEGSNLSGVSARCSWREAHVAAPPPPAPSSDTAAVDSARRHELSDEDVAKIRETLRRGLGLGGGGGGGEDPTCAAPHALAGVHLEMDVEAARLVPAAISGRLRHGRHFTFKCVGGEEAVTLVTRAVAGALVDERHPLVAVGRWLQVLVGEALQRELVQALEGLEACTGGGGGIAEGSCTRGEKSADTGVCADGPRYGTTTSQCDTSCIVDTVRTPETDEKRVNGSSSASSASRNLKESCVTLDTQLPRTLEWPEHRLRITILPKKS